MIELTASHAGLLLIFLLSAKPLGLGAKIDKATCKPLGYHSCHIAEECCSANCVKKYIDDEFGICSVFVEPPPSIVFNEKNCKRIGFMPCIIDDQCCSTNCSKINNSAYGVCRPLTLPAQPVRKRCKPLGYKQCTYHDQCCSTRCVRDHHSDEHGECVAQIKPTPSKVEENDDVLTNSGSDNSHANTNVRKCMDIGFNMCSDDYICCSGICSIEPGMSLGLCTRTRRSYEKGVINVYEGHQSPISISLLISCKAYGSNVCKSHSECCSGYCMKEEFDWIFGQCEVPRILRPVNDKIGIYEKGKCRTYWGVKRTMNGEEFNEHELTAAHRTLPFNTLVRVTVGDRHVAVRINDRTVSRGTDILQFTLAAANGLGFNHHVTSLDCDLIIIDEENCTPTMAETCVLNDECCSQNCYREYLTEPGFCIPHTIRYENYTR